MSMRIRLLSAVGATMLVALSPALHGLQVLAMISHF